MEEEEIRMRKEEKGRKGKGRRSRRRIGGWGEEGGEKKGKGEKRKGKEK